MDTLRQLGGSILLAIFSVALVIGGISLAMAESYIPDISTPTDTQALIVIVASPSSTPIPLQSLPGTATVLPSATPTATVPPPTSCPPPTGWVPITVGPGDDLVALSYRYHSTPEDLLLANCLFSVDLPYGSIIYVPSVPTNTPVRCGPPVGWIQYTVRPGNTMYSLSQAYGTSISQLQLANCMSSNQYNLAAGQVIWVPNVITRTPRATATATLTPVSIVFPTLTRTATVTQTPTQEPTGTNVPTATNVPTSTATGTATATASSTAPAPTPTPTATATITAFPSQSSSP
jgi:LysM repeat protein